MAMNRRDLLMTGGGMAAALAASSSGPVLAQNASPSVTAAAGSGSNDLAVYAALTNEKKINVTNLRELEAEAKKILPPYSYAYISGGAGDEWTMRENEAALNRWVVAPHYLAGVKTPDISHTVFGAKMALPVFTAPMGGQGIAHAGKEATNVKGTNEAGTVYVNSSVSNITMEEIAAAGSGTKWFQIYFPADRGYARELLQRAKASGHTTITVTVDSTTFSNRERPVRVGVPSPNLGAGNGVKTAGIDARTAAVQKADLNWDDVAFCMKETGLPVIIKGVLTPAFAAEAVKHGVAGVWVSNHGGRAIDCSSPAIAALPAVVKAVNKKAVVFVDGGFRRGQDIFRALALGADAVGLGRPVLYGMALGGAQGIQAVYARLKTELTMVMQLAGTPNIKSIGPSYVSSYDPISTYST